MRPLTFPGFLKSYVQELAGSKTVSMCKLATMAKSSNPRLREPLALYAHATGKTESLFKAARDYAEFQEALQLLRRYEWSELLEMLKAQDARIPDRYLRVYQSYCSARDRYKSEVHTKQLMHRRITALKQQKSVSNYRIYTTLGLNPGNVNAFLKHGDTSKLSLSTARKTLAFLDSL